jgi:hypothetical protein
MPRRPLVENNRDYHWITEKVCGIVESKTPTWWWVCFALSGFIASFSVGWVDLPRVHRGRGVGSEQPDQLGLGDRQLRFLDRHWPCGNLDFGDSLPAETTMENLDQPNGRGDDDLRCGLRGHIPAVSTSGAYGSHGGCFRFPNANGIWPNFRSPLEWDVFAVSTYFTVSALFWYMGMIPDLGLLRDRATQVWRKYFYGVLAMGWRNSARHWKNYEMAYLILAGLSTPSGAFCAHHRFL